MRRMILVLTITAVVAMLIAVPVALGQAPSAVVDNKGVATATAGGTSAKAGCPAQPPEATAGGVVAKAPCKPAPPPPPPPPPPKMMAPPPPPPAAAPPPPPPAPKAAAPPPPPPPPAAAKVLPKTGGIDPGAISLAGLSAGVLIVGSGLLVRRLKR